MPLGPSAHCVRNDKFPVKAGRAVKTQALFVDVSLADGPAHAMTIADPWQISKHPPNMQVALKVDAERFLELFLERMAIQRD